jgi:hypothetical protein
MSTSTSNFFIHFGCWNNGGCPKNNDLTNVLDSIKSLSDKPQFLSICGDNYYPNTTKITLANGKELKKKQFNYDELLSGFKCLPTDLPIYMTYGNHDFETNLFITENEQENTCTLTQNEISIVKEQFPNIHLELFQSILFQTNTLLLFLDTTIYDNDDIEKYKDCYKTVDSAYSSVEAVKNRQVQYIEGVINDVVANPNITNIVIVGHHPIAQFKLKKEKMRFFILNAEFNDLLFDKVFLPLESRNVEFFYLCADLHQYQCGDVTINGKMKLRQYIVGTGGAKKDPIVKEDISRVPVRQDNVEYFMSEEDISNSMKANGFLKCVAVGDKMVFDFIRVGSVGGKLATGKLATYKRRVTKKRLRRKRLKTRRYRNRR